MYMQFDLDHHVPRCSASWTSVDHHVSVKSNMLLCVPALGTTTLNASSLNKNEISYSNYGLSRRYCRSGDASCRSAIEIPKSSTDSFVDHLLNISTPFISQSSNELRFSVVVIGNMW